MSELGFYQHVIVHGVGLIGGSVAAAVKHRRPACRVTGVGRNPERLQSAQIGGLIDDWCTTLRGASVEARAVVVICLPVDHISEAVIEAAEATPSGVLITDAGSVKQSIQDEIAVSEAASTRFVGAHPIAGSEKNGFEYADPELFAGRPCVVTESTAGDEFERRCQHFWRSLGAEVSVLDCEEHDRILALTSHLPHVMAAITANCVSPADFAFAGSGFRDSTRVASGDAHLWQQILYSNRTQLLSAISKAEAGLSRLSAALKDGDHDAVVEILEQAAQLRRAFES
ncbi:MAG: prephenate dehydrogenase [Fuerstiella sp.]|nr:prephenate dehydrogenase [Fuerstiella sp.]